MCYVTVALCPFHSRLQAVPLLLENVRENDVKQGGVRADCQCEYAPRVTRASRDCTCKARTLTPARLCCVLICVFPCGFSSKREIVRSLLPFFSNKEKYYLVNKAKTKSLFSFFFSFFFTHDFVNSPLQICSRTTPLISIKAENDTSNTCCSSGSDAISFNSWSS